MKVNYKIVADSTCDLTNELKEKWNVTLCPLTMTLDDVTYIDDDNLNVRDYLDKVKASNNSPVTAAPSPESFLSAYEGDEEFVYVTTLSEKVSATYSSAVMAKDMFYEKYPNSTKKIHIFDSRAASTAEVGICEMVYNLSEQGLKFEEIIEKVNKYISTMHTLAVLDSVEHLRKSGRINRVKSLLTGILNIKLVLIEVDGELTLLNQARGLKQAADKAIESIGEIKDVVKSELEKKKIYIAHCFNVELANYIAEKAKEMYNFKEALILQTRGLSSNYAEEKGVLISF